MDAESQPILIDSKNSDIDDVRKTENPDEDSVEQKLSGDPATPDKNDSDILVIDEDSPDLLKDELRQNHHENSEPACATASNTGRTTNTITTISDEPTSVPKEEKVPTPPESNCAEIDIGLSERIGQLVPSVTSLGSESEDESKNKNNLPEANKLISATSEPMIAENVASEMEIECGMLQVQGTATSGQILQRSASVPADEASLNQAALTLLKRLEFKNPGRKQMDYGNFNPEESEREKKKLRRFQTSKPRGNVCYKEDGTLFDGRDICDCLNEECTGCFYPCPQCESPKCGPTCRVSRKWVYDYIEDEGHNYKVEFPEAAVSFGV